MQSFSIWVNSKFAVAYFCVTALFSGCSANKPPIEYSGNNKSSAPQIKRSQLFSNASCVRSSQNNRRLAFFGLQFLGREPIVADYYYCNGESPAKDAGILIGDRILSVRGCQINSAGDVAELFKETPIQTLPIIKIDRGGLILEKGVKIVPFVYGTASISPDDRNCQSY